MKQWAKLKQTGFTIVELLIVIVVIAILAAITIVAYNGIQNRAKATTAQNATAQAVRKAQAYAVTNNDMYPSSLADAGVNPSQGASYQYSVDNTTTPRSMCITAVSQGTAYSSVNGGSPVAGACAGHSTASPITNRATNPSFEVDTTGWTNSVSSISFATSTAWASSGTRSLLITNTGTSNSGDVRITTGGASSMPFGMEAGKTYTISARVNYAAAATGDYNRGPGVLAWYSTNGTSYTEQFGPKPPATPGTYTVSSTVTLPSTTTGVLIALGAASSTAGQQFAYDSFMITEGSGVYFYGDGNATGWGWNGAQNQSSSFGPAL